MNEIIDADVSDSVSMIASDNIMAVAAQAEKRIEAIKKIKILTLKVTNSHDWVDQQGKPYLLVSGAEKVRALWGISWSIDPPVKESFEDGHFNFTYTGKFTFNGCTIEVVGSRSSRDGFFKRYNWINKVKTLLPPSEIDSTNVQKAAYTNCIGNGITRILGIRNMTWEDLKEAGIKIDKMVKIEYNKKEMSDDAKNKLKDIKDMMVEMHKDNCQDELEKLTTFTASDGKTVKGKRSTSDLSEKQIPSVLDKVKKAHDIWTKVNTKS